jgi:tRNA (adenine57-N1/adenine58-N1)-methyltransferase catalytic subunit
VVVTSPAPAAPPDRTGSDPSLLREGESVLFIDRKARSYLKRLRPGRPVSIRGSAIPSEDLIGAPEGVVVRSSHGEWFQVFRPTYAQLIPHLPRKAQVIYPKDVGTILLWGDIRPGATVVEIGVGPGATTMALLRAVGSDGSLTTYEIREDHVTMACDNVARFHGEAPNWTVKLGDAYAGLDERDVDRIVVDVPEPWRVVPHAAAALRPGGVLIGFVPTVLQVKQLVEALRDGGFAAVETIESLLRNWHVKDQSVRPEHRMVAHSGFLVVARRLASPPAPRRDA